MNGPVPVAAVFGQNVSAYSSIKKPLSSLSLQKHPKGICCALLNWCPVLPDVDVR
jgi:hypothetical protein